MVTRWKQKIKVFKTSELYKLDKNIRIHTIYFILKFVQVYSKVRKFSLPNYNSFVFSCLQEFAESALHKAISHENGHSLHIVDFIVQNSCSLDKQSREGNTPLHYCVIQDQSESMRLLLRAGANASVENNNGKSPLAIAKERNHHLCEEMVSYFYSFKGSLISYFSFSLAQISQKKVPNHYPEHLLLDG